MKIGIPNILIISIFASAIMVAPMTMKTLPWLVGTDNDEAAPTADWTDEEGLAFAIHPAKALALADAAAGGKGYT